MKRLLTIAGLVATIGGGVAVFEYLDQDRQYRSLLETGQQALDGGNSYLALESFSGAVALRPQSMAAYYWRGRAYRAQRRDADAIRDLREAARLAPDATEPLIALGDLYNIQGEAASAAEWYGQAAKRLKDQDPVLLYKFALAKYRAGWPAAALEPLLTAIARNDAMGEAYYLLGLVQRDLQRTDEAIAALERAIKVLPTLTAAREELADLDRAQDRPSSEMGELQALAALDQQFDRSVSIALAEARHGQFDSALGTLSEAASRAQDDSQVQLAMGRVYLAQAERTQQAAAVARALASLEKALGGTARRSEGLALYGRALYLAGDYRAAERILREAVATSPVDLEAFARLADAAERAAHYDVARDALVDLDVLQGDTATPDARLARAWRIGQLARRAGDFNRAVDYLSRVVAAGRADTVTLGALAQSQWHAGDADGAKATLARALSGDPRNAELLRLRRLVK